ncbi:MAG: hypothetical protein R2771_15385 [Saprospiraceae bacterium]
MKDYKEYRQKVNEAGKKAIIEMGKNPLTREQSIEMFRSNKELALKMRMERNASKENN